MRWKLIFLSDDTFEHILATLYTPSVEGRIAIYDGYSSDLSKTGDLVCSTGSSAGILFYGDTITYPDGSFDSITKAYENDFKTLMSHKRNAFLEGNTITWEDALIEFIK